MNFVLLHFNLTANPYTWCKIKNLTDTPSTTRTLITLWAGGGGDVFHFSKIKGTYIQKDAQYKI